jgi:hypothetical protein
MNTEAIVIQLGLSEMVCRANTAGVSHDESLVAPKGGGNCMNWVVGHLVKVRHDFLALLERPRSSGAGPLDRYVMGSEPLTDAAEAVAFPALVEEFQALREPLVEAVRSATPEMLARPIPDSPTGNPNETVGSYVASLGYHDAYHLGQAGLLRRILGKTRNLP